MFMGPRNWCQGMNSASLCSLAGRYENPIPPQCRAPIDFLKIPALYCYMSWCLITMIASMCYYSVLLLIIVLIIVVDTRTVTVAVNSPVLHFCGYETAKLALITVAERCAFLLWLIIFLFIAVDTFRVTVTVNRTYSTDITVVCY